MLKIQRQDTHKEEEEDDDESKPDGWEMRRFKVLKMQIYINSADDSIIPLIPFIILHSQRKIVKFKRYLAL